MKVSKMHRARKQRPDIRHEEYTYTPTPEVPACNFAPWRIEMQNVFQHLVKIKPVSYLKETRAETGTETEFGCIKTCQRVIITNGTQTLSLTFSFAPCAKRNVKRFGRGPDGRMRLTGSDQLSEALLDEAAQLAPGTQKFEQSAFAVADFEKVQAVKTRQKIVRRGMTFDVPDLPIGDLTRGSYRTETNREGHTLESFRQRITQIGGQALADEVIEAMRGAFGK